MDFQEGNKSRVDFASDQIIRLILEQNMRPGDRLPNEYDLACKIGVGRSTLREAVKRLVSRHVLETRQGAGTFVAPQTGVPEDPLGLTFIGNDPKLALELSDVRMLIEPTAAKLAAIHASEEDIEKLELLCEEIQQCVLQSKSYIPSDLELHRQIGACCSNSILRNLVFVLSDAAAISIRVSKDRHRDVAYPEHLQIVRAIKRRDPDGAFYAMLAHLNTARQSFAEDRKKQFLTNAEPPSPSAAKKKD